MDFVTKSFRKDETLTSWTLLQHICPHFWAWLLLYSAITPKSEDKYVAKVFNWSEFHLSEMTCYKIHISGKDLLFHSVLGLCVVRRSFEKIGFAPVPAQIREGAIDPWFRRPCKVAEGKRKKSVFDCQTDRCVKLLASLDYVLCL